MAVCRAGGGARVTQDVASSDGGSGGIVATLSCAVPRRGRQSAYRSRTVTKGGPTSFFTGGTFLVLHLALAGWVRWKDEVPQLPAKPNSKSPLAARIVLDNGSVGERSTMKKIA